MREVTVVLQGRQDQAAGLLPGADHEVLWRPRQPREARPPPA